MWSNPNALIAIAVPNQAPELPCAIGTLPRVNNVNTIVANPVPNKIVGIPIPANCPTRTVATRIVNA